MKKLIIALMGLFTLFACSEDAYREADKLTETGTVENNLDGGIMPPTNSPGYDSPFQPNFMSGLNKGILTTYRNTTPLFLELTPYGEDIHVQNFLSANGLTYPPSPPIPSFSPLPSTPFLVPPGAVDINLDPEAPLSVNAPPYSNPQGAIVYDFGNWSTNWRMYHYGKIYYFKYKVLDNIGNVIDQGIIKHNFYNDTDDINDIPPGDSWLFLTTVPDLLPTYNVAVMYHADQDEMCLTNYRDYLTDPLPSSVDVPDPVTGNVYTLEFTSNGSGMNVNFM